MPEINWNISKEDDALIRAIVERAKQDGAERGSIVPALELQMDLTACHLNGCPLELERLLKFDSFDFWHDIAGIRSHIDRDTGQITKSFLPRSSKRRSK